MLPKEPDMKLTATSLGACCLLCASAVSAVAVAFPHADRNGDGVVSYEEARRSMSRLSEIHFQKSDRNGDGVVDRSEYPSLEGIYRSMYRDRN
jgi:Ca2+-binding EF-hand superfamily protein